MDTLQFLLFLYVQQLHKVSLRRSLLGDEWPSPRTKSPSLSGKSAGGNKVPVPGGFSACRSFFAVGSCLEGGWEGAGLFLGGFHLWQRMSKGPVAEFLFRSEQSEAGVLSAAYKKVFEKFSVSLSWSPKPTENSLRVLASLLLRSHSLFALSVKQEAFLVLVVPFP